MYPVQQSSKFSNIAPVSQQYNSFSRFFLNILNLFLIFSYLLFVTFSYNHLANIASNHNNNMQWNSNIKKPNSNSEIVKMGLRNSVQARQNATSPNSIVHKISHHTSAQNGKLIIYFVLKYLNSYFNLYIGL